MSIAENVAAVRERLEKAAPGRSVLLVAATKMNDASRVREAIAAGVDACGENRVQELLEKREQGAYEGAPLHFIGTLQKNKVKYIAGTADLIESVDDDELMSLISRRAQSRGAVQDILLEVSVAGEEQKGGIPPEELPRLLELAGALPGLRVRGLMTVPPICRFPGESSPYFDRMNELFVDIAGKKYDNVSMDFLSMGMSGDFEEAARRGANMVRVGTAIFGERHYNV